MTTEIFKQKEHIKHLEEHISALMREVEKVEAPNDQIHIDFHGWVTSTNDNIKQFSMKQEGFADYMDTFVDDSLKSRTEEMKATAEWLQKEVVAVVNNVMTTTVRAHERQVHGMNKSFALTKDLNAKLSDGEIERVDEFKGLMESMVGEMVGKLIESVEAINESVSGVEEQLVDNKNRLREFCRAQEDSVNEERKRVDEFCGVVERMSEELVKKECEAKKRTEMNKARVDSMKKLLEEMEYEEGVGEEGSSSEVRGAIDTIVQHCNQGNDQQQIFLQNLNTTCGEHVDGLQEHLTTTIQATCDHLEALKSHKSMVGEWGGEMVEGMVKKE